MKDCRADDEWCADDERRTDDKLRADDEWRADDERRTDDKLRADDEWRDGSGYFTCNARLSISFFRNIYTSRWKRIYFSCKTYIPLTQNVYTFLLKSMDVFSKERLQCLIRGEWRAKGGRINLWAKSSARRFCTSKMLPISLFAAQRCF